MTGTADRILLVEDEENVAFTLAFNLRDEGYVVDVAPTLADARRELVANPPDLVVLDVMLPDGSGFDLAREMRDAGQRMRVLMLTALGAPDDVVRGLESGADDFLAKPFAIEVLLVRIRALLRRREWDRDTRTALPDDYVFGTNTVNFVSGEVSVEGKPQDRLTDLELRLLRYLAGHANEAVSRQTLLEAVWELPPTASTRTVDNFIVRLRKRFEANPSKPRYFLTVHGVGYRFVPEP